jgi:hypothetical protein
VSVTVPAMTTTRSASASWSRPTGPSGRNLELIQALDLEWAGLRTSRRALRTARAWAHCVPHTHPFAALTAQLDDLDQLLAATQRPSGSQRTDDDVLLVLVSLARVDELAGRVVLQHLLPGLIAQSRRYRSFRDPTDPLEVVVPLAWIAIRSYDVERRPRHVASSLLSDSLFQAFRRPLRRMSTTAEELRAPSTFSSRPCHDDPDTPLDEFVTVLRESQRAGVSAHDIDLLRHLVRAGSPSAVARERNVTPRTIRNHRDRAVDHVRTAVAVAVAA